jgi:hypothetical protein
MNKNVPLRCEFEFRSDEVYSIQHYVIKFVSVSIIDWNFTKNFLYLFVLMLFVQAIFFLLIYPLFFFINQHFNKQYKNTGSYYRNFFP